MEQRPLGRTGLTVSALGFGCGNVGGLMVRGSFEDQVAAVQRALDAGITYFDTAALYGNGLSEQNLGRVLRHLNAWDRVTVGTKFRLTASDMSDPAAAMRFSLVQSLKRLDHDHVDLLQLHNRIDKERSADGQAVGVDDLPAIAEAMRGLVSEGLVRFAGHTGLGDTQALHRELNAGYFDTVQAYFNALNPSAGHAGSSRGGQDFAGLIDIAAGNGMGVIAIRVMAAGALVGHEGRAPLAGGAGGALTEGGEYKADIARSRDLEPLARELSLESTLELGLRFVLAKRPVSTALVGYSDLDQLESAIRWTERGPLPDEAVRRVLDV